MVATTRVKAWPSPAALVGLPRAELIVALFTVTAFLLRPSQIDRGLFGDEVPAFHDISGHGLAGTVHTVAGGLLPFAVLTYRAVGA